MFVGNSEIKANFNLMIYLNSKFLIINLNCSVLLFYDLYLFSGDYNQKYMNFPHLKHFHVLKMNTTIIMGISFFSKLSLNN